MSDLQARQRQKNYRIMPGRTSRSNQIQVVARDGIEPPTPAFSGPRSTTELPGQLSRRACAGSAVHSSVRDAVPPSALAPGLEPDVFRGESASETTASV